MFYLEIPQGDWGVSKTVSNSQDSLQSQDLHPKTYFIRYPLPNHKAED
jgi:hypothetical protein